LSATQRTTRAEKKRQRSCWVQYMIGRKGKDPEGDGSGAGTAKLFQRVRRNLLPRPWGRTANIKSDRGKICGGREGITLKHLRATVNRAAVGGHYGRGDMVLGSREVRGNWDGGVSGWGQEGMWRGGGGGFSIRNFENST